ncbi:MAG TPA: DUF1272 domain-containing protein [Pseudonocardiaceae bacterium]|nr:DUF1272 domain-containing protein [Pseudonocardiaceae bacterium]
MLELRPNCESCDRDLAPDAEVYICSFECTWCPRCAGTFPDGACPNCGGDLRLRPVRPSSLLSKFPASTDRIVNSHHNPNLGPRGWSPVDRDEGHGRD